METSLISENRRSRMPQDAFLRVARYVTLPLLLIVALAGCAMQPTALERRLFAVETNLVTLTVTNLVTVTNLIPVTVTNEVQGIPVLLTNLIPQLVTVTNTLTRTETNYVLAVKPETAANVSGLARPWLPAYADLIGVLAAGLAAIWTALRNAKHKKTAAVLAQGIETGRAILKSTPQGAQLEARWLDYLQRHQTEAGVILEVARLLNSSVNPAESQIAAAKLVEMVKNEPKP